MTVPVQVSDQMLYDMSSMVRYASKEKPLFDQNIHTATSDAFSKHWNLLHRTRLDNMLPKEMTERFQVAENQLYKLFRKTYAPDLRLSVTGSMIRVNGNLCSKRSKLLEAKLNFSKLRTEQSSNSPKSNSPLATGVSPIPKPTTTPVKDCLPLPEGISKRTMKNVVKYLYTGQITLNQADILEYLRLARYLDIPELIDICDSQLFSLIQEVSQTKDKLTFDQIVYYWAFLQETPAKKSIEACLIYLVTSEEPLPPELIKTNLPLSLDFSPFKEKITDQTIQRLAKVSTNLLELKLTDCPRISDISIELLVAAFPRLQLLALEGKKTITATGYKNINKLTNLKSLYFSGLNWINAEILREYTTLRNLEHLCLRHSIHFTGPELKEIGNITSLTSLNLEGCVSLKEPCIEELKSLKNLQKIILNHCVYLTDNSVIVLNALPNVKIIETSYCSNITQKSN